MDESALVASTSDEAENVMLKDLNQALSRIHSYEEIRLFIAGTPNFGHQASSVNLLLRLSWDYAYAGLITVVYDPGNPRNGWTVPKLRRLLHRHIDPAVSESLPQRLHLARLQWFSDEEFAARTSERVDFGMTGGAEIGRIYRCSLADMLNVRTALKMQPFQWPWCRDGIDFCTQSNQPPVDLLSDEYLGWRLFHRAYRLPSVLHHPLKANCQSKNDAVVQQLLTVKARVSGTSLSCLYGVRREGVCRVDPANLLYVYFLALFRAFSRRDTTATTNMPHRRILVVNFDDLWNDAFTRLEAYVYGQDPLSTSEQPVSLPISGNLSNWIRCIRTPEDLPAAINWSDEPRPQDSASDCQACSVKILYVQVGFVSPESFVEVLQHADLPTIFEGQHTASAVASLGKPYLKLRDSVINNPSQVLRIPDDTCRHSDVVDRIQAASLNLQLGALREMALEESVECVSHLLFECTDPSSPLHIYLNDLEAYYRQRGADKFETLLSAWNKYGFLKQSAGMKGTHVDITPGGPGKPKLHIEETRELLFQLGLRN
ncbi:uncharacterized protein CDV56_101273 [Aspergillus thermomutatus]|uniref:Uncharacterized protein n=1 Tax=Aspergillus thermomutatus TaxID=41047 RepID=A0A397H5V6_ASPTH|nr:uncharacterized protein CDV56_101273 [Aspergillus thermomutatus]RHZ55800.1 hypothetical protein CDV56_101273 [Aspergillus thermomutatus]